MMKKKKAEMGIGTLIIFIAMILVAAVAAGVLIQTSGSLQSKALLTGERSKDQIATALQAVSIAAEDGSTGNNVDTFYFTVKLAPGSDDVRLADTLASVATADMSANYKYNSTADCDNVPAASTNTYAVKYLLGGDSQGYITEGDVVMVCYKTTNAIGENEEVTFALTPKVGNRLVVDTSLPEVITNFRTQIYPSG